MDTHKNWIWNPYFIVHQTDSRQLILKNDCDGALILMSALEYEILRAYASDNDLDRLRHDFHDVVWEEDKVLGLLEKAKSLELLQTDYGQDSSSENPSLRHRKRSGRKDSGLSISRRYPRLYYLGVKLVMLLQKITGLRLTAEFNGNLRFFKWFSIDLDGSLLKKAAESARTRTFLFCFWAAGVVVLSLCPWVFSSPELRFSGFGMEHYPVGGLFVCMIVCIFICLFIHECGHYLVYKAFGGHNDRMGLGCMFVVFPVLYTQIDQVHLWKERKKRMLLSASGMLADIWIWLITTNILCFYHHSDFFSLICSCLFYYYCVQIVSNLNCLLPGTDGYYLLEDAVGAERLFGEAYECTRDWWRKTGGGSVRFKGMKIGYFCCSCLCISLYWLALCLLLTFPLWSNLFLL